MTLLAATGSIYHDEVEIVLILSLINRLFFLGQI
jgi:hypothetical protein